MHLDVEVKHQSLQWTKTFYFCLAGKLSCPLSTTTLFKAYSISNNLTLFPSCVLYSLLFPNSHNFHLQHMEILRYRIASTLFKTLKYRIFSYCTWRAPLTLLFENGQNFLNSRTFKDNIWRPKDCFLKNDRNLTFQFSYFVVSTNPSIKLNINESSRC